MGTSGKRSRLIKARRRNKIIRVVVIILLILIAAGLFIWFKKKKGERPEEPAVATVASTEEATAAETGVASTPVEESESGAPKDATSEGTMPEEEEELELLKLEAELNDYIAQKDGDWSICLKRADSSKMIEINADRKMRSASLIKLYVAGCCLDAAQNGGIEANDDLRAKIEKMLTVSDNDSCNELIDLLGSGVDKKGFDKINAFIQKNNYPATEIGRKMLEKSENDNYTSTKDCVTVLEEILNGSYVNQEASDFILTCLKNQERVSKIPAGIPKEIPTANKTGELDGQVENDAAIVWAPDGTYILCIMSEINNSQDAINACVEISEKVYDAIGENEVAGSGSTEDSDGDKTENAGMVSTSAGHETGVTSGTTGSENNEGKTVSEKIRSLSLEDKISYLVVSSPEAFVQKELDNQEKPIEGVTIVGETTKRCLESHPNAAGFMISSRNVENSDQLEELIDNMKKDRDDFPMLFILAEDELSNTDFLTKLERNTRSYLTYLLKNGTYEEALSAGKEMGEFLDEYGVNVYLTPDLNGIANKELTGDTDVIGGYIEGLRNEGIHVCAAYFPEKGTAKDSDGFSLSDKTRYELDNEDLEIMKHAVNEGVDMIMVPNTRFPEFISENEPASLSKTVMNDMIRNELRFSGVIITEVMNRDQLKNKYTTGQAAAAAIQNGADMVIVSEDYDKTLESIMDAVQSGNLKEERINEAVQRVYDMMNN